MGDFWQTDFTDVVRGNFHDYQWFIDELEERDPRCLSRLMPIRISFHMLPNETDVIYKQNSRQMVDEIHEEETFCMVVNRRGLKGAFSATEIADKAGRYICKLLERYVPSRT
jgi:tRNA(Ser,Leu) C12 N-acetylase TAN1